MPVTLKEPSLPVQALLQWRERQFQRAITLVLAAFALALMNDYMPAQLQSASVVGMAVLLLVSVRYFWVSTYSAKARTINARQLGQLREWSCIYRPIGNYLAQVSAQNRDLLGIEYAAMLDYVKACATKNTAVRGVEPSNPW